MCCGAKGSRTPDLYNAIVALYQLSYGPWLFWRDGEDRHEQPAASIPTPAAACQITTERGRLFQTNSIFTRCTFFGYGRELAESPALPCRRINRKPEARGAGATGSDQPAPERIPSYISFAIDAFRT